MQWAVSNFRSLVLNAVQNLMRENINSLNNSAMLATDRQYEQLRASLNKLLAGNDGHFGETTGRPRSDPK